MILSMVVPERIRSWVGTEMTNYMVVTIMTTYFPIPAMII